MRTTHKIVTLGLLLLTFAAVSIAWLPVGTGIQPALRDIIAELKYTPNDPGKYAEFRDDFFEFPEATVWDTTSVVVDAGSLVAMVDSLGIPGCLKITLGANSKGPINGMNIQTVQAPFKLIGSPGKPDSLTVPIEFETKLMVNNATQSEIFAGLTIEDQSLSTGQTYGIFFKKKDNSTSIYGKEIKATEAAMDSVSCGTIANRTWYRLKFTWNGNAARFYINDVYKGAVSTAANQPVGTHLKPTIEISQGDSTASYAYIDYVWVKQKR